MEPVLKKITHIGLVVKDIDKTVATYADNYGIGPWSIYGCDGKTVTSDNNKPEFMVAFCYLNDMGIELIQPVAKNNIFFKFLKEFGENLHHITYETDNFEKAVSKLKKQSPAIFNGNYFGKNKFEYFDLRSQLKHIVKLAENNFDIFKTETTKYGISWPVYPSPLKIYPEKKNIESMRPPVFKRIGQVAFMVKSIDDTVKQLADEYGIGPWKIWEFGPDTVYDMTVWGKKKDYRMRLALTKIGNIDFEIIQPHDSNSIYYEYMEKYGEGFHHLAYEVEDFKEVMKDMEKKSVEVSMSGKWEGQHKWVYLTTEKDLKHIVELNYTEPGYIYPEPLMVYPQ